MAVTETRGDRCALSDGKKNRVGRATQIQNSPFQSDRCTPLSETADGVSLRNGLLALYIPLRSE